MAGYCDTRRTIYIKCRQKIKERQLDNLKGKSKQKFTTNRNQSLLVQCTCNKHTTVLNAKLYLIKSYTVLEKLGERICKQIKTLSRW